MNRAADGRRKTTAADGSTFQDSPWVAGLRFLCELAAWVAIYFAWGWVVLVLAIAALTLFSVPGDQHLVLVRVPGPVRMVLEAGVGIAGVVAAQQVWGTVAAVPLLGAYLLLFFLDWRRWTWMWAH